MGFMLATLVFFFSFIAYQGNFKERNQEDREIEIKWSQGGRKWFALLLLLILGSIILGFYYRVASELVTWNHVFYYIGYGMFAYTGINLVISMIRFMVKGEESRKRNWRHFVGPLINMTFVTLYLSYMWTH